MHACAYVERFAHVHFCADTVLPRHMWNRREGTLYGHGDSRDGDGALSVLTGYSVPHTYWVSAEPLISLPYQIASYGAGCRVSFALV